MSRKQPHVAQHETVTIHQVELAGQPRGLTRHALQISYTAGLIRSGGYHMPSSNFNLAHLSAPMLTFKTLLS